MATEVPVSRRVFLLGGLALLAPRAAVAQTASEREHLPRIQAPSLSEDPAAVPVEVSVAHPMEPDHFIRSIEVRLDEDPVPYKGTFLFTPANGQASVAFTMRSGAGGVLKAIVECSKHGRFTGTREIRVAEGGCATAPDTRDRSGLGNARIRLPQTLTPGEIAQVRVRVDHNSYTGLVLKGGRYVREAPEFYIKQTLVLLDEQQVSEFRTSSALSANPLIRFPLRVPQRGALRVVFLDNEGRRWEASQAIRG